MHCELLSPPAETGQAAPAALFRQALTLQARSRKLEAAHCYLQALQAHPRFFEAAFNLGVLFQEMGQVQEAIRCYERALQIRPESQAAWGNLGAARWQLGRGPEAIASFRRALRLEPGAPGVLNNLGTVYRAGEQYAEALGCFREALRRDPANAGILCNLGNTLRETGAVDEAIECLRQAVQLRPDLAEAHWDLGYALLLRGELVQGFQEHEWRWQRADFPRRTFGPPLWRGEPLAGRTLLVHTEQGAGDAIQFVRYVRRLAEQGARVVLECPAALVPLFRSAPGAHTVLARGSPLPPFHAHVPLLSLPQRFRTALDSVPAQVPYLRAPAHRPLRLPQPPGGAAKLKVGLAWRGNPKHQNDRRRSLPLALLEPVLALRGATFYSFQLGAAPELACEAANRETLLRLDGLVEHYGDTAALVEQLDLVISVDTSLAHLAGALGRPVWTLLPFAPDWRWLEQRTDTPWYPTMRLFRQPSPGDWAGVVAAVRQALLEQIQAAARLPAGPTEKEREAEAPKKTGCAR